MRRAQNAHPLLPSFRRRRWRRRPRPGDDGGRGGPGAGRAVQIHPSSTSGGRAAGLVLVTADKGLCAPSTQPPARRGDWLRRHQGKKISVAVVGRKGRDLIHASRHGHPDARRSRGESSRKSPSPTPSSSASPVVSAYWRRVSRCDDLQRVQVRRAAARGGGPASCRSRLRRKGRPSGSSGLRSFLRGSTDDSACGLLSPEPDRQELDLHHALLHADLNSL